LTKVMYKHAAIFWYKFVDEI